MTFETRFNRRAAADPRAFDRAMRQRFGFDASGVDRLLSMASKLSEPSGGQLSSTDVKTLQALHPRTSPRDIADMASRINESAADRRFELFAGLLADDPQAMYGNHVEASDNFKAIAEMTRDYTTAEYAEAVNAKRGGSAVKPAWTPEKGSVRDLLERATASKGLDNLHDAFEAGDPYAESVIRNNIADRIDNAADRLEKPGDSRRDSVEAAFDLHQSEAVAAETFGMGERT